MLAVLLATKKPEGKGADSMRQSTAMKLAGQSMLIKAGLKTNKGKKDKNVRGFTLIETIISLALVTVVFVSLAQLFTISIMQNVRSHEISNAIFLAQQQIDYLRTLTTSKLSDLISSSPEGITEVSNDEQIDINADGTIDFRRITQVGSSQTVSGGFDVQVLIFPPAYKDTDSTSLIENPEKYKVRAYIHTIISR